MLEPELVKAARYIVAVDPGPITSGMVVYDREESRVVRCNPKAELYDLRAEVWWAARNSAALCFERTQAGPPSTQVVLTTEVVGRLMEMADAVDLPWTAYYRRHVLFALGVGGAKSKDAVVRQVLLGLHGGTQGVAIGTKKNPGPLYGVSSHGWAALAVAVTHNVKMRASIEVDPLTSRLHAGTESR